MLTPTTKDRPFSHVLIVDDDRMQTSVLSDIMQIEGLDAVVCGSASEAAELFEKQQFGVVVVDLRLPDDGGIRLLEVLSSLDASSRFIIHTGYASLESAKQALDLRAFAYVEKSGDAGQLLLAVHRALHERAEEMERMHQEAANRTVQAIVESALDAIVLVNAGCGITWVNAQAERLFGYRREELLGKSATILIPHGLCHEENGRHRPDFGDPGPRTLLAVTAISKGGSEIPVEVGASRIDSPEGRQFCLAIRDMTARKELEAALLKKGGELRQSQKLEAVGQLAGGIAHEFNNLLQAIGGHTGFAMEGLSSGDQRYQDLLQVRKAADRAAVLTRQLLGFGRRQMLERKNVDPNSVVADLGKMVRPVIGDHIELDLTLGENVGTVLADPGELQQVLLNLCLNARDAMPSGGKILIRTQNVVLRTTVSTSATDLAPGRYAVLSVTDTGCGMTPEVKERIFEPFFTTKKIGEGTGLGLATIYGIVQQHEGTVHAYSEPGRGTTFKIYLPTVDVAADADSHQQNTEVPGGTETILVAEDEPMVRELTVRVLRRAGYRVFDASDGEEAWSVYQENREGIALLMLDAVMPGLTGHGVYDRVKAANQDVKVLFCTGYDPKTARSSFIKQENLRLIQKPFDPAALLCTVREVLDQQGEKQCQVAQTAV